MHVMNTTLKKLSEAIEAFSSTARLQDWDKPWGAMDNCSHASDAFLWELSHHKIEGEIEHFDPSIALDILDYPYDFGTGCIFHWAVRVNDLIVDWTARQFHVLACFPLIWQAPRRAWRNVPDVIADVRRDMNGIYYQNKNA